MVSQKTLTSGLTRRWQKWLDRRIPEAKEVILNQRSIFIIPSRVGWLFFIVAYFIADHRHELSKWLDLWSDLLVIFRCHKCVIIYLSQLVWT
jgi:hypothetical protein